MAGQGEAADFAGAAVQDVKQDSFTLLDADRLAASERMSVDRKQFVADLIALGLFLCFLVGSLSHRLQFRDRRAGEKIHRHVAAAAERRLKFLEYEKHLAVVDARIVLRFDIDRAKFA